MYLSKTLYVLLIYCNDINVRSCIMFGIKKCFIFIVLIVFSVVSYSQQVKKPRIVVCVVLENFSVDYLSKYSDDFGDKGFNRLIGEGICYKNAYYPYMYSQTGVDHASINTGVMPSDHGIVAHEWYDRLLRKTFKGVSSDVYSSKQEDRYRNYSPKKLLANTLGDELKKNSSCSRVFSVSMNAESSIFSAGHMADAAYWFNHEKGEWCTSSYYIDLLNNWTKEYNKHLSLDYYVNRGWHSVSADYSDYKNVSGVSNNFFCDLHKDKERAGNYKVLKASPYANVLVSEFVRNLIINENLGKDNDVDLLNISYSFLDYKCNKYKSNSEEKLDVLYRLDKELGDLLEFLDEQVGKGNYLVSMTVSQPMMPLPDELNKQKLPGGYFSSFKAVSLLKSYLNIKYGQADWISSYDSQQIYLNRELIDSKKLDLKEIQDQVVDFLIQFSGIHKAIPSYLLSSGQYVEGFGLFMCRSYSQKRSGDVMYMLNPGWINTLSNREDYFANYSSERTVPLVFYGLDITPKKVYDKVSILDIMPSLSVKMGIPIRNNDVGNILTF